jgi:hypothetical protein
MLNECTAESNLNCLKVNETKIKNWPKGRNATLSLFGKESVIEQTDKDNVFIGFSGIANPEPRRFQ